MSKTIAYLRVSTIDQDLEKNKAAILHLANEKNLGKVHFVEETVDFSRIRTQIVEVVVNHVHH